MNITKEITDTRGRYVTVIDGYEAELTFSIMSPKNIIADHTGVPEALGGRGVGKALVEHMIEDAQENGFRIVPLCPFVKAQYARHPDWKPFMNGR